MDTITVERPSLIRTWKTTYLHLCTGAPISTKMSLRVRIDFPQKTVFVLGIVLSIFGIASIIVAVVAFSEKIWGHYLGTGLWCGISMFLTGLSGVVAGQLRRPYIIKTYLIMSVISACLSAVMLVLSAGGLDYDSNFYKHSFSYKKYPKESTTIIHVLSLCLAIFGFGVSLASVGVCIKYLFFEKANSNSSHQNSREIHNLMCTSNGGRLRDLPGLRTPLRERSFTRSTSPRESTSSRIPLRESETVAASTSHTTRFHSPRHGPSSSHANQSTNTSSSETSRFLPLEQSGSRRDQHCQDSRREHVDLARRMADRDMGTPSSVRSDCSQGSYVAAVELMPAASSDFPPQYDDLTPNIFGEDELPPYEEVIRELTDSSDGETAGDVDLHQERYVNCPVASDPPQASADVPPKLAVVAAAVLCKDDTQSHRPMSFVQSSSAPPFPTSIIDKRKSEPQMSKNVCKPSPTDKTTAANGLKTSESHAGSLLTYAAVAEATTSGSNKLPKTVAELSVGHNPQGVTYHDFSGTNLKCCNHCSSHASEENTVTGAQKSNNQHKSTNCEGIKSDREYIILQDSYENCSQGAGKDSSNADLPPIGSHFSLHSSKMSSPTKGSLLPPSPHHGDQHSRSQNKRSHPASLLAKCEPAKVSSNNTATESTDNPRGRSSSHSERSGVKLVPLPKDVLSSGGRSKPTSYYNRNKRELILPAKEFDPLPASMKVAEKLSLMGSPEKHRTNSELVHSRSKQLDCSQHKSDSKHQKSKEDKNKDALLVCRPKARIDGTKSGMVRYSSDRSQRKFSTSQAERMHQFRWSDSKKRIPLPQKLPSTVRDWDASDHSQQQQQQQQQQKIVAEFSPASIFQCPPNSQSTNLLRSHDIKKVSPSLGRKGISSNHLPSSKSMNPRDEIHVAPEDILNIRSKPDRDGSAFVVPGNVSPEVRYVPRLFHKSPQKSCSSSQEPPRLATVVTTVPTTLANFSSTSTSTITSSLNSADSEEDDHDDSEPLYSNDPPHRETPSAPPQMTASSSDSSDLKEPSEETTPPLKMEDDYATATSRKILPAEQAYMNISEAHTVIVPMARISPLTVNKSTDEIQTALANLPSSPLAPNCRISLDDSLLLRTKKLTTAATAHKRRSDNVCTTKLLKCYPSSDIDLAKVKGSRSTPSLSSNATTLSSPPLLSVWRHSEQIVNTVHQLPDSQEQVACKPIESSVEISGAEAKAATQPRKNGTEETEPTVSTSVSDNNTSQQSDSSGTADAASASVVANGNDGIGDAPAGAEQEGAAVVNVVRDVAAEAKPMYSLLL